jgi:hypothetical protein
VAGSTWVVAEGGGGLASAAPLGPVVAQGADEAYVTDAVPAQFDLLSALLTGDREKIQSTRTARSEFEGRVTNALSSSNALSAGDQEAARNWVAQVLMAEMTSTNPDIQSRLGDLRQELFRKFIRATSNEASRNFLINNVVLPKASEIASKNYHPAARINAALVIGLLDSQEGVTGQRPPRPSLRALGTLVTLIDDPQSPEYLVAACLSGVQRHAEIDGQMPARDRMLANARQQLVDSMLKLLKKYESNQTELEPGYIISRRAIQTLGSLNLPGNDPLAVTFKQAAQRLADNSQAGPWLRLDAMLALAKLPMEDPIAYLESLGRMVVLVSKTERTRVIEAQKLIAIDKLIKDRTGMAIAKKMTSDRDELPADGPMGAAGAVSEMGAGRSGSGGGSMGGGFMDLRGFDDSGLFPYHLHYARTNIKVVATGALEILGTRGKTPTGLKVSLSSNTEANKLIDLLDREFKKLLSVTDIGLVEEKPLTEAQRRAMDPQELSLLNQSDSVRVLAGIGKSIQALEKLVGAVELPGASRQEAGAVSVSVPPAPANSEAAAAAAAAGAAGSAVAGEEASAGGGQAENAAGSTEVGGEAAGGVAEGAGEAGEGSGGGETGGGR